MNKDKIVASVYTNPKLWEPLAIQYPDPFRAFISMVPVADWINYALVSKRNADRVIRFAGDAPVAFGLLSGYLGLGNVPPVEPAAPGLVSGAFATDFLRGWPGGDCSLFHHSKATTEAQRNGSRAFMVQNGYTCLVAYAKDAGDGDGKHHCDVLADVAAARNNLRANRAVGLYNVMIVFSDAPGFKSTSAGSAAGKAMVAYAAECVRQLDDLVDMWVAFLEPGDSADDGTVNAVGQSMRALTSKKLLCHTHPVVSGSTINTNNLRFAKQGWCDGVAVQTTHPDSPISEAAAPGVVAACRKAIPAGKLLIMLEYSWKSSEKALGDKLIDAGADGVGDGCSAAKVAKLPKVFAGSGAAAVAIPEAGASAVLSLVAKYSGNQIRFEASGIAGWPKKLDKKKNKYLGGAVRIKGTIVDHFWYGATTAFVSNAWGNDEHRISVATGEVVPVQLVSTDGQQVSTVFNFKWPFQGTV